MKKKLTLRLPPSEAADSSIIQQYIAEEQGCAVSLVTGFTILKKSIDARSRNVFFNLTLEATMGENFEKPRLPNFIFKDVSHSKNKIIIVGSGPAGLFAALQLIEKGMKPIILERGKDVKKRRRDLATLNKEGVINPESNYCFGEGGAGTYSDGKLYTRSNKRGDIGRILQLLVYFGANENIIYEAHPHIGTNKLPQIIGAIRNQILDCGGEFIFDKKVVDFEIKNEKIKSVKTADGNSFEADAVILATGHSARDIFQLLAAKKVVIEAKPFALGVRVEHPQALIDSIQYHCPANFSNTKDLQRGVFLPPASYSAVHQVNGKGVFSFCMCPGGIIAPAATAEGELVVNGWSPSKRNNAFANSGIVVAVEEKDIPTYKKYGALSAMNFQQEVEQKAFESGGGKFVAPAQRLIDFTENKISTSLSACSYLPGVNSTSLKEILPAFVHSRLQIAFKEFGKKMRGYFTNEAIVVATESRTSSPVRIPRNPETYAHPQIQNLYPCGEGAGYAGGIVSAAMDGELSAKAILLKFSVKN